MSDLFVGFIQFKLELINHLAKIMVVLFKLDDFGLQLVYHDSRIFTLNAHS